MRPSSCPEKAKLEELYKKHKTGKALATAIGVTPETVGRWLHQNGIDTGGRGNRSARVLTDDQVRRARALKAKNADLTSKAIKEKLNLACSTQAVWLAITGRTYVRVV